MRPLKELEQLGKVVVERALGARLPVVLLTLGSQTPVVELSMQGVFYVVTPGRMSKKKKATPKTALEIANKRVRQSA